MIVTQNYIENFVATKSPEKVAQFIGRALVVVFNNQTESEKTVNTTNVDNGVGFTGADAHSGSITAKYFLKHGTLLDWQVERWTKRNRKGTMRFAKYWRQLDAAAQAKVRKLGEPKNNEWAARVAEKAEFARLEREQEARAFMAEIV